MNWDDLRIFLAVARTGGLLSAARKLDVDHTTVARRLTSLEAAIGAQLIDRSPRGARLTDAGSALLEHAERIETETLAAAERLRGADERASGVVRLATPEAFGAWMVTPALPRLQALHPGIELELVPQPHNVNLTKREADLAVTLARPPKGRLYAQKLTNYHLGLYASEQHLERLGPIASLAELQARPMVGYIEEMIDVPELRALGDFGGRPAFRSSSIVAQQIAVASGVGVGLLHVFAAEQVAGLKRVLADEVEIERSYWLAVHADQRHLPRVRAVIDFLHDIVAESRAAFVKRQIDAS